ncbi:MAG: hypothetical protein M3140_00505 [Actinomycetota bacterium]|nr:hypothetical protein [Actinomycetota bacterium]
MRVYLPATTAVLADLATSGEIGPAPLTAFAVTPDLRAWYVDEDVEELEYAASGQAVRASLRMVDADPTVARRRVVVAADVADTDIEVRDDLERGAVRIADVVPLRAVAAVHIDDAEAEATIARAAAVVLEADLGSASAQEVVDDAEGFELSWYAPEELAALLAEIGSA